MNKLYNQILIVLIFVSVSTIGFSQKNNNITLKFIPVFNHQNLKFNNETIQVNDSIHIDVLKFYISSVKLLNNDSILTNLNHYYLIDFSNPTTTEINLPLNHSSFNQIQLNLGIDSLTNVSGAMGGNLDPVLGMYWTWQSGYINCKIEGIISKQSFQFHLGGYLFPYLALQTIKLNCLNSNVINIYIHLDEFFDDLNIIETNHIMSPGKTAVKLSKKFASAFKMHE